MNINYEYLWKIFVIDMIFVFIVWLLAFYILIATGSVIYTVVVCIGVLYPNTILNMYLYEKWILDKGIEKFKHLR